MLNLHFPHPWCVAKFFAYPLSIFCLMQIQPAFAGVISITTATESRISDSSDTIEIETVVRNDGDEPALDVALEFPQLQKGFAVSISFINSSCYGAFSSYLF